MVQSPKTSQGGASLSSKVRLPSMKTVPPILDIVSSQIQWACYKKRQVDWETKTGMCWWLTSTFKNSYGCTALVMPEWREMTEQIDWRAKQPSQVACFSEDLKCWGVWDTACRHKAKDVMPSVTGKREAWNKEVLNDLPWKDERARAIVSQRWTLELFQRMRELGLSSVRDEHWNCFKGWES